MSEHADDKPVTDVPTPDAATIAGAFENRLDGRGPWVDTYPGPGAEYGVIVTRTSPLRDGTEVYIINSCSTAKYRDETLVAFHTYYDSTIRVGRFGPDLQSMPDGVPSTPRHA